jgi:RNA polymerase sigma factor (sigma-70 family)
VPQDDSTLAATVIAAKAGDEAAWALLVRRFTPALRAVAKGYRLPAHDVDDVVQASWLAALRNLHALVEPAAVGAWLATTARRQALRAHQRAVHETVCESSVLESQAAPDCLETAVVAAERVRVLRDAVERLPRRQRDVLQSLIEQPDRSYGEVSEGLGIPVGSIGPTRLRGLRRLRDDDRLTAVVSP